MADQAVDDGDDVFIFMGGRAPQHVINAIIDESVKEIDDEAFMNNPNLRSVEFHVGVEKIRTRAFNNCPLLRRIKLPGVKFIEERAFLVCAWRMWNLEKSWKQFKMVHLVAAPL